ncbi:hypothetical protein NE551_17180, partial [Erysipelatoclostridium ramosum]|uniref:hypothetical protein n=1 Tax=Thomasclavelia ramosa TaxID=1547 RepID=UPI00210BDB59
LPLNVDLEMEVIAVEKNRRIETSYRLYSTCDTEECTFINILVAFFSVYKILTKKRNEFTEFQNQFLAVVENV